MCALVSTFPFFIYVCIISLFFSVFFILLVFFLSFFLCLVHMFLFIYNLDFFLFCLFVLSSHFSSVVFAGNYHNIYLRLL